MIAALSSVAGSYHGDRFDAMIGLPRVDVHAQVEFKRAHYEGHARHGRYLLLRRMPGAGLIVVGQQVWPKVQRMEIMG